MTDSTPSAQLTDLPEKFFSRTCAFCTEPVDLDNPGVWREIVGWVHGPKRDGLCLRATTGQVGHDGCVHKAKQGEPPETPSLFDEPDGDSVDVSPNDFTS